MSDGLAIETVAQAAGEVRRASSSCHSAKLDVATGGAVLRSREPEWLCRECGQPCSLVLSDPEKVMFHG